MNRFVKKISPLFLALAMMLSLTLGAFTVSAQEQKDMTDSIRAYCEQMTTYFASLPEESLLAMLEGSDALTTELINGWQAIRAEVGELAEEGFVGGASLAEEDGSYIVTVPVTGANGEASFVYTLNADTAEFTAVAVQGGTEESLGTKLQKAGLNTLMGLGTVFAMLILLSFLISLFKYIGAPKAKKKEAAPAPAPNTAVAAAPAAEEVVDDTELIAVITAAIAAAEGSTTTDGFVVRSIRRARRR